MRDDKLSDYPVHEESGLRIEPHIPESDNFQTVVDRAIHVEHHRYDVQLDVVEYNDGLHVTWGSKKFGSPIRIIFSGSESEVLAFLRGWNRGLA